MKTFLILLLFTGTLFSCNRQVYVFQNETEKRTIYLKKHDFFMYEVKNEEGRFNYRGSYLLKNDNLKLTFGPFNGEPFTFLPINKADTTIAFLPKTEDRFQYQLTVKGEPFSEDLYNVTVELFTDQDTILLQSEFNDQFFVETVHPVKELKIYCSQCPFINFDLEHGENWNMEVVITKLWNAHYGGCLVMEGPSVKMKIKKENDKITEIIQDDFSGFHYKIKRK